MSYTATYKKLDTGEAELIGEIAADVFDGYRAHAISHIGANMEIPGFRKGKAPESVLEKQIPEMAILEEMANHAIMAAYPKMLEEHKIEALGAPAVQITKIARGNALGFVIRTAVMPEVTLPDYKKIAADARTPVAASITDAEFEEALKQVQAMRAQGVAENKARIAKESGTDTETKEASADAETAVAADAGAAPETEAPHEALPDLDDEYVQTLGAFENVADFKVKFRENLLAEKTHREEEKNRLAIIEKLLAATTMTLPKILIDAELDRMVYRMKTDIQSMGLSYDDYLKHMNKSEEAVREELRADAEKRVRMEILVDEIAKKENIKPEETEFKAKVAEILAQYPGADKERAEGYIEQVMVNEAVFKMLEGK